MRTYRHQLNVIIACMVLMVGIAAPALLSAKELILCDFETVDGMKVIEGRAKVEIVAEHATQGAMAGKVPAGFTLVAGSWTKLPQDWSGYDQLCLDIYNPGEGGRVSIWITDEGGTDYWQRHNNGMPLRKGKNTLKIAVGGLYRGEKGSGKFLDKKNIRQLVLSLPKKGDGFYLDNFRLTKGAGEVKERLLIGFETGETMGAKWSIEDWPPTKPGKSVTTPVAEHVTQGATALKFEARANGGAFKLEEFTNTDWSGYDSLEIDCYNTADKPVRIGGWFRDWEARPADDDYWKRHNYSTNVKPGVSTIRFPLGGFYRGEKGSGKFLDTKKMHSLCISTRGVTFYLDNIRLVKGSGEKSIKGMLKFDFGPPNSATFPGFTAVTKSMAYSDAKGFGWVGGAPSDERDYEQPDTLVGDWVRSGGYHTFGIKVPNGDYKVYALIDSANYWGWMYWRNRSISAEGTEAWRETQTPEDYLGKHYFKHQDTEDLPGTDIWTKYVYSHHSPKTFDATVNDGQLDLKFQGDTWGLCLNALVIYPAAAAEAGALWIDQLDKRRKDAFYTNYAEVVRKADAAPADKPADGFILFQRDREREVYYNSAPGGDPTDSRELALDWSACAGEYESAALSVYPLKDCGDLTVIIDDLKGPQGALIPGDAITKRAIPYKFKRIGGRITSSYNYRPFALRPFESWPVGKDVTRRFWFTLKVPENAVPGKYTGRLTVKLAGVSKAIPIKLQVYPFSLDDPTMPIAMYGGSGPTGGSWWPEDLMQLYRHEERVEEVLRDQFEHGMTAVTPPAPSFKGIRNGKAEFDYSGADKIQKLLRKIGYKLECFTYASMFRDLTANADANARKKYGIPLEEAIKLAYEELGRHMKEANWLPMAWALADEPLIHGVNAHDLMKVFLAHRAAAPQMQFVSEDAMGDPHHWEVIPAIDIICANSPRYKVAEEIKRVGGRYWFNNIARNRLTFGWYMLKARQEMGVEALFQWGYSTNKGDIYYDLDGSEGDSGCSYTTSEGQRAMRHWETIREGADDHRYIQTALNLIEKAGKAGQGKAEAAAAMAFIKEVMSKIDLEKKSSPYTNADLDRLKTELAGHIIALRKAVQ